MVYIFLSIYPYLINEDFMADEKPAILSQIADRYGITVKTVTRRIKEHPELGVTIEPRKAPTLSENQIQAVCNILDPIYKPKTLDREQSQDLDEVSKKDSENKRLSQLVSELREENARLTTDLAVSNARNEENQRFIKHLEDQTKQMPKLLEASAKQTEEIKELKAQIEEVRDNWKSKGFLDRLLKR